MGKKGKKKNKSNPPSPTMAPASQSPEQSSDDSFLVVDAKVSPPESPSNEETPVILTSPIEEIASEIAMDAEALKEEGNAFYKAADYVNAIKKYDAACEWAESDKLRIAVLGNRSMCHMQVGNYQDQLRFEN